ncbi:MAG: hypothetical protein RSC06_13370, partial [Clostridia bacterium]
MELATKEKFDIYLAIVRRAQLMGIAQGNQFCQMMDIKAADKQHNLRLEDWLNADAFNFAHDFCGIQNTMNRHTAKTEGYFLPRFARPKRDE